MTLPTLYNPHKAELWGIPWYWDAELGCWLSPGWRIHLRLKSGEWQAYKNRVRAKGDTPEQAMTNLLGDPIEVTRTTYYPVMPKGGPQQSYANHRGDLGNLHHSAEGWRFDLTSGWYPTPEEAASHTVLNCWGTGWVPEEGSWVAIGMQLTPVKEGWVVGARWGQDMANADSPVGATPEQALEAFVGPPITVFGVTYYPKDKGRYFSGAQYPLDELLHDLAGWQCSSQLSTHETPEGAFLVGLAEAETLQAEAIQEAHKVAAELRQLRARTVEPAK